MNVLGSKPDVTGITSFSEESEISHAPINGLPYELLLQIFSSLDFKTLGRCSLTCKRWNALSFNLSLLQNLFFKSLPQTAELYKKRSPEAEDNDFFLRSLKSDARMRSAKVQSSSRTLIESPVCITCFQVADGKVLSGSADGTIRVWDIESGKELRALKGHTKFVDCLHVVDGKVFSGSLDGTIRIWDIDSGKELRVIDSNEPVRNMIVDDGKIFVQSGPKIKVFDFNHPL